MCRHAFGDQYKATNFVVPSAGKLTMRFEPEDGGAAQDYTVFDFKGAGVAMGMYNTEVHMAIGYRYGIGYRVPYTLPRPSDHLPDCEMLVNVTAYEARVMAKP